MDQPGPTPLWGSRVKVLNLSFGEEVSSACPLVAASSDEDFFAAFIHAYQPSGRPRDTGYAHPAFSLSARCLILIEVTEYSHDWQGGNWPLKREPFVGHSPADYPRLKEQIMRLREHQRWGDSLRIKRGLSGIEVWIKGDHPEDTLRLINAARDQLFTAESLHVRLTFR